MSWPNSFTTGFILYPFNTDCLIADSDTARSRRTKGPL